MSGDAASALARHVGGRLGLEEGRVRVEAAGRDGEIAVLLVPGEALPALLRDEVRREVAGLAREAGFDHVAVDLALDAALDRGATGRAGAAADGARGGRAGAAADGAADAAGREEAVP